jgi:broad specificity phosphatase PhoE
VSGRLVLVRHGQSYGNVDKRLDTRPPGAELTPLGREQARDFAKALPAPPGLLLHSVATRAVQTAQEISDVVGVPAREVTGIHEVQAGDLENRNDEASIDEFHAVYERWLRGEHDVSMPGGESANQVLDRYLPVVNELRTRYLDDDTWTGDIVVVSHGAAIRLTAALLGDVPDTFALDHHLANAEFVALAPDAGEVDRWICEQWGTHTPPFDPEPDAEDSVTDPMG